MKDFIIFFRKSVKKYPITKFFLKLIVAEIIFVILQAMNVVWKVGGLR